MITTGPFTIAAGETVTLTDPYPTSGQAAKVQIQNASPLTLSLANGSGVTTVPADSAQTVPLSAQPVVLTAAGSGSGTYYLAWLMVNDPQPVPNGPLTSDQTTIAPGSTVEISGPITVAGATQTGSTFGITEASGSNIATASATAGASATITVTLVAASAGQEIVIQQISMQFASGASSDAFAQAKAAAASLGMVFYPPSSEDPFTQRYSGLPAPADTALLLDLYGGSGGATVNAFVLYSMVAS